MKQEPLVIKFINKQGEYTPDDVAELRKDLAERGKIVSAGMMIEQLLNTRVSLELIAAIQKFDSASDPAREKTFVAYSSRRWWNACSSDVCGIELLLARTLAEVGR